MLDFLPLKPVPDASAPVELPLNTARARPAAPSTPRHTRRSRLARRMLDRLPPTASDLGLPAPQRTDPTETQQFIRTVSAVDALAAAGLLREAIELARAIISAEGPTVSTARLRCTLSSLLYASGRPTEAATEAGKLLSDRNLPEDVHEAAEMVLLEAVTALEDPVRTQDRVEDAEAIVTYRERHSDEIVVVSLTNMAHAAWAQGKASDALDLIHQAVGLASTGKSRSPHLHPRLWLAGMLTCLRRFDEAEVQLRILRDDNDKLGHRAYIAVCAADLHLAAGRVHDAAAEVDIGLATADAWGTELFTPWALSILATTALRRGDLNAAARHADSSQRQLAAIGYTYGYARSTWVAAQVAEARAGSDEAMRVLYDLLDTPHLLRRLLLTEPAAAAWLVRTSLACADHTRAETVLAQAQSLAADNPDLPTLTAAAIHASGVLDRDPSALHHATTAHRDPFARASAAEDLATLFAHQGRDDHAIKWYCHAMNRYEHSESARDATRVRRRLRERA